MADAVAAPIAPRGPDILIRTAPALSATTDAPLLDVPKPPASASNDPADHASGVPAEMSPEAQAAARTAKVVDPADTAAVAAAATAAADIAAAEAEAIKAAANDEIETIEVDGKAVPLPPWMKREITKARNRQRDAETIAKTASDELAAIRATVDELKLKVEGTPKPVEVAADPRPTRDKFDDPEGYDQALTEWAEREGERKAVAKVAEQKAAADADAATQADVARRAAADAEIARLNTVWTTKVSKAVEKYSDYNEVTNNDAVTISMPMAHAIVELENGTDVAYHLGKNLDEAARIAGLSNPVAQAVQITLLAARLATPPPRAARVRPLEPLDTGSAPSDTSEREASMEEHAAKVNGRFAALRRPFMSAVPPASAMRH